MVKKSYKIFKPTIHNVLSTGTNIVKIWLSLCLRRCVGSQGIVVKCTAAIFFSYGGLPIDPPIYRMIIVLSSYFSRYRACFTDESPHNQIFLDQRFIQFSKLWGSVRSRSARGSSGYQAARPLPAHNLFPFISSTKTRPLKTIMAVKVVAGFFFSCF